MEDWVSKAVASWPSIAVLGALTIVEFVAKCVPCVDAVYESSMSFVAPILSVFGSMSAFGLFNAMPEDEEQSRTLRSTEYNYNNLTDAYHYYYDESMEEFNNHRRLTAKSGWLVFLQVVLCTIGVIIAILVHLFKLLMRVIGEGCCTCCITSVEYTWTVTSVIITILIVPIAIATAVILIVAAGVGFKKKVYDKKIERRKEEKANAAVVVVERSADKADVEAAVECSADQVDVEKKKDEKHVEKKKDDNVCDALAFLDVCNVPVDEEIGTQAKTGEVTK